MSGCSTTEQGCEGDHYEKSWHDDLMTAVMHRTHSHRHRHEPHSGRASWPVFLFIDLPLIAFLLLCAISLLEDFGATTFYLLRHVLSY